MQRCSFFVVCLVLMFAGALQAYSAKEIPLHYNVDEAIALIVPENETERKVLASEEWIEGARWGEPRSGHPEGAVIYHIHEVLENVETYYGDSPMREKLRIITIIHDTFKHKVDFSLPKRGENQHGMIARRFAEKFLTDETLLEIIQKHDDAYFAWQFGAQQGDWEKALQSAYHLIDVLGNDLELFIAFYKCDNRTGDKTPVSVEWFDEVVSGYFLEGIAS